MCEDDKMVRQWLAELHLKARANAGDEIRQTRAFEVGYMRATLKELAANVPGAREFLIEHMPWRTREEMA